MAKQPTQADAAKHLGVTDQSIRQMLDKFDMPRKGFDLDALRLRYITHLREVASGRISEHGDFDLTEERARLAHHQANNAAIEEQVKKGQLVPASDVERVWGDLVMRARSKLLASPTRDAHRFVGIESMTVAQEQLKEVMWEALRELSVDEH